jgi:hypothetical protein
VLRRLDQAGLLAGGADVARQTIPQEEIAALLQSAQHERAQLYLENFRAQFHAPKPTGVSLLGYTGSLHYRHTEGVYAPGIGYDSIAWTGARRVDDRSELGGSARLGAALAPHVAAALGLFVHPEAQLVGTAGPVGAAIGRRQLGYGVGEAGGLVLDAHRLDAASLFLTRPLRLPVLGATRFEMHLAQIDNVLNLNGTQREIDPWFWTARGSIEPLANLRIGINRGMIFGGEGNLPITFNRVAKNLIGVYTSDGESSFANQIISVDFRYRLPKVPFAVYLDWASDDAAGGWWDVPGILAGVEYAAVRAHYDVAFGLEHTQFKGTCCSNSIWYRNAWFRGSWADDLDLLGHPLGGHGREWRVFANGGFGDVKVMANAAVYLRRRRDENILVPAWQGKSAGVRAGLETGFSAAARLLIDAETEWGSANDWSVSRLSASWRVSF